MSLEGFFWREVQLNSDDHKNKITRVKIVSDKGMNKISSVACNKINACRIDTVKLLKTTMRNDGKFTFSFPQKN